PILNPCRWDPNHVGDIFDFESAQTLCRVIEIPEPLPDSRDTAAEPLRNQCQRCIAVDGPEQVVLVRVRPSRRSLPTQLQRCRSFLNRIPGPRRLLLPDSPPSSAQTSTNPGGPKSLIQLSSPAASFPPGFADLPSFSPTF